MLTNILATLIVAVTTNTYAPKQYWHPSYIVPCTMEQVVDGTDGSWRDEPTNPWYYQGWNNKTKKRDNPDVRITEVREIKTLSFYFDGKTWTSEISNTVISAARKKRVVIVEATTTNGATITTTTERWADE